MRPGKPGGFKPAPLLFLAVSLVIGAYYLWGVRAAGYDFIWKQNLDGYYDHLGRAFAGGHLYLPVEPSPRLLALANPWDPRVDDSLKLFDAVLFHRRYYLYHGAGPAVLLFAPWRLITHHDLPENFALFLFCFGGFLFSGGALMAMLRIADVRVRSPLLALLLLVLGLCQGVPFLLNRVWVYEVAIGAGYFCVSAGLFFYFRSSLVENVHRVSREWWIAAAGLMFGLAISCRPHLGIAGVLVLIALARGAGATRRCLAGFAVPFVLAGLAVATYNFERFGNPFDFGNRYLVGGANQTEVRLSPGNVLPGMYYLLGAAPELDPVFPWVLLRSPPRDIPRPPGYTVEPTVGALYLAPFVPFCFCVWGFRRQKVRHGRGLYWILVVPAALVLLFITATGWSTQRYEVDFLPLLVLCACAVGPLVFGDRGYLIALVVVLAGFGIVTNLALGISGPFDEMLKKRPARFVTIARWFSPVERFRPELVASLDVTLPNATLKVGSTALPLPDQESLFAAGRTPFRYELDLRNTSGKRILISSFGGAEVSCEFTETDPGAEYRVTYSGPSGEVRVTQRGAPILIQEIGALVTARSQVRCGAALSECKVLTLNRTNRFAMATAK